MFIDTAVFICHRWTDVYGTAFEIQGALNRRLSTGSCYLDCTRPPGALIRKEIKDHLEAASVVLVLIGPGWKEANKNGIHRLLYPDDPVRQEIEFALNGKPKHERVVIPVAVGEVAWGDIREWLTRVPSLHGLAERRVYHLPDPNNFHGLLEHVSAHTQIKLRKSSDLFGETLNEVGQREKLDGLWPLLRNSATNAASPYVGLAHFKESDAPLFFGRASETLAICNALKDHPFVLVYGQSGVGKSSLLCAGVLPRLPGTNPYKYERRNKSLGYDKQIIELLAAPQLQKKVIILDQIDEIFSDPRQDWRSEEAGFWNTIAAALNRSHAPKLVLSFRSEYYARIKDSLMERKTKPSNLQDLHIRPLDRQGVLEAILGVTSDRHVRNQYRLAIDDFIVRELSKDALGAELESHVGPLLQYNLRSMWDEASGRQSHTDEIKCTRKHYLSVRCKTLDEVPKKELEKLRPQWAAYLNNGLVWDVLHSYATDGGIGKSRADRDVRNCYSHIKRFSAFFSDLKDQLLLLSSSGTGGSSSARLAHDSLAPMIRVQFQRSDLPGPRASRLVEVKQESGDFSESDIATIQKGEFGMSKLPEEIQARVKRDEVTIRSEKKAKLGRAIRDAKLNHEHLQFDKCLGHLREALSWSVDDQRVWEIACRLPYPLSQLKKKSLFKKATDLLEENGQERKDERDSFYPRMVNVEGGKFRMGNDDGPFDDEKPAHTVHLSNFQMSATPVTWWQFGLFCEMKRFRPPHDAGFGRGAKPVINVTWRNAVDYCIWLTDQLSQMEGKVLQQVYATDGEKVTADLKKNGYRLPTEAEWEYAAREGGGPVRFGNGKNKARGAQLNFDCELELPDELTGDRRTWWEKGDSLHATSTVGQCGANQLKLCDMSGNVFEWCWDWWSARDPCGKKKDSFYDKSHDWSNPEGPVSGERKVVRGGSWMNTANLCRCTYRWRYGPQYRFNYLGFRVVRRLD